MRNDPDNPASWFWPQSNSATNAFTWPMSNYWVVSANNELAYSKTGGEFNLIGTQSLGQNCSLINAQLPPLTSGGAGIGEQVDLGFQQFSIPLRGVLECLEDVRLDNRHAPKAGTLGWQVERSRDLPLAITGIQIAIEQAIRESSRFSNEESAEKTRSQRGGTLTTGC